MSKPRLLLHVCCAPDATVAFERLNSEFDAEGFFYNPNIHPEEEYLRRLNALEALSRVIDLPFTEGPYETGIWHAAVRGLEGEREGGRRCEECIRLRIRRTAEAAKDGGFDAFAAVFSVSPHKSPSLVDRIGGEAARDFGTTYLATDLKKKNGFKRSVELSRTYGIYRQDYCGCVYSRRSIRFDREKESGGS
ncbi:MAG: epoxyqueuosine reductase QueH [bacterium]|nr:MAG: epoxyqueuosine reductase QueH [bacterium]